MPFHNRKRELGWLDEWYGREGGRLIILYSRRRVGKTALIEQWLSTRTPHLLDGRTEIIRCASAQLLTRDPQARCAR